MEYQYGHGGNYLGEGYRSFLLSDVAAPSLYLKGSVELWKIKYTSIWIRERSQVISCDQ